jgi:hypothetical protein
MNYRCAVKKHRFQVVSPIAVAIVGLMIGGCSQPPKDQIELSATMINYAASIKAVRYAPKYLKMAVDSFYAGQEKLNKKRTWFATPGTYADAESTFVQSQYYARLAIDAAVTNKMKIRSEIDIIVTSAECALDSLEKGVLRIYKESPSFPDSLRQKIDGMKLILKGIAVALDSAEFDKARQSVESIITEADSMSGNLKHNSTKLVLSAK